MELISYQTIQYADFLPFILYRHLNMNIPKAYLEGNGTLIILFE